MDLKLRDVSLCVEMMRGLYKPRKIVSSNRPSLVISENEEIVLSFLSSDEAKSFIFTFFVSVDNQSSNPFVISEKWGVKFHLKRTDDVKPSLLLSPTPELLTKTIQIPSHTKVKVCVYKCEISEEFIVNCPVDDFYFEFSLLNDDAKCVMISNQVKISKGKEKYRLFKIKREFLLFRPLVKELEERQKKLATELSEKGEVDKKDTDTKKKAPHVIPKKKVVVKELEVKMERGKYEVAEKKKWWSSSSFKFPIEIVRPEVLTKFIDPNSMCFKEKIPLVVNLYDCDEKQFDQENCEVDIVRGNEKTTVEVSVSEYSLTLHEFPIYIELFIDAGDCHFISNRLKLKEFLTKYDMIEKEKKQNVFPVVIKELKENLLKLSNETEEVKNEEGEIEELHFVGDSQLNELPYEMIYEIVGWLPMHDAVQCTLISKYFHKICNYQFEKRVKVYMVKKMSRISSLLFFLYKKMGSWRKLYGWVRKMGTWCNMVKTKDEYDDCGATMTIRKCF